MPLKLSLKPYEKILINGAVIENGGSRAEIVIHNKASILRQNDILKEENVNTPAKRIFYIIQLLYISQEHRSERLRLLSDTLLEYLLASPSSQELVNVISMNIIEGRYYAALQACKKLIQHEARILKHESDGGGTSLRQSAENGRESATNGSPGAAGSSDAPA